MRAAWSLLALLAACVVDEKRPLGSDLPDAPGGHPDTAITAGPEAYSRTGSVTFVFSSTDAAATFECSIDLAPAAPCKSPASWKLDDGTHSFSVRAIGSTGDVDPTPAEHVWSIDSVAPDTMLLEAPPPADNSALVEFRFRSNETSVVFECSLDNGAYAACVTGVMFGPLGDGTHSFAVRARDRAGNLDASPVIHAWLLDTSTPDTVLLSGPSGPTPSASATFTFLSPDAGSGATFQCSLDGVAYAACTSPRTYSGLAAGNHTFAVRVRDAVGNVDPTPATRTWTADVTPPSTTITSGPSGSVASASATFTFTSNEAAATFACRLDGGPFAPCTSPFTASGLAQGGHTFVVRATDAAGLDDPTPATAAWTVDTIPPGVTITSGPANGATSGPRVTFSFIASEGTLACSLDGAAFAPCASPFSFNASAGSHQFRVRATDTAGNATTETRTWTVACVGAEPVGAAALLHLDDTGQVLANAIGGPDAVLGDAPVVEAGDPAQAPGRFIGGLVFTSSESDHVSWPLALGASPGLAIEAWARPESVAGARDLVVSGDGRIAIRSIANGASVQFSVTVVSSSGPSFVATSAPVAAGAWHHVLIAVDAPALHLWVDGAHTTTTNVQLGSSLALAALRLGGNYQGALDEIWVSQSPITTDDAALRRYCPL